jgi:hypothetical protein
MPFSLSMKARSRRGMLGSVDGHPKDVPCAYCASSVVRSDFVLCSQCGVPAHRECWAQAGRCPVYACGATQLTEPALALFRAEVLPAAVVASPTDTTARIRDLDARIDLLDRALALRATPPQSRSEMFRVFHIIGVIVFLLPSFGYLRWLVDLFPWGLPLLGFSLLTSMIAQFYLDGNSGDPQVKELLQQLVALIKKREALLREHTDPAALASPARPALPR